jgi:hypothetical protein
MAIRTIVGRLIFVAGATVLTVVYVILWVGCDVGRDGREFRSGDGDISLERAGVAGYLAVSLTDQPDSDRDVVEPGIVFVPNVRVWLRNLVTGQRTATVRTDLSGRFVLPPQPSGDYELCWAARGFVGGCGERQFSILDDHVYLKTLLLELKRPKGHATFVGRVRFADGSIPRTLEPLANVNSFASVRSRRVPRRRAYVNNFGDYILPAIPLRRSDVLEARIEGARSAVSVSPASAPASGVVRVDITFANHRPRGLSVAGALSGGHRWSFRPGSTATLRAEASDPDGDALKYRWIPPNGSGPVAATGQALTTRLPPARGMFEYTAVAYDGKGGYATDSVRISTEDVWFTGTVSATNAPLLQGATVTVNGKRTVTNGDGHFEIPVRERPRYILNIRKPGYGLVSGVYDGGLIGGRWTMTRASVATVDPTSPIDVTNERLPSDCPGRLSLRRSEQQRNQESPRQECGTGIRVMIPPNSLVDRTGAPPTGPVDVELTTVDLQAPDAMPGDYLSRDANGDLRTMESYGAGTIEIRAGGREYNLARGRTATVVIPVDPTQLASGAPIPDTIPLLVYRERSGIWIERGKARRFGNTYVARVEHLSALNVDLQFTNPACMRLETVLMPPQFRLEITIPSNTPGAAPVVRYLDVDNATRRHHLLWRLPTNQLVELRAFQPPPSNAPILFLGLNPAFPISVVAANTGGPQQPPTPQEPPYPYDACRAYLPHPPLFSSPAPIFVVELVAASTLPGVNQNFLTGLYSFKAANLSELNRLTPAGEGPWRQSSYAYLRTIDPLRLRENLDEFKSRNKFPTGEVRAVYANFSDLGLGREMHCNRRAVPGLGGYDVACYVVNYGYAHTDDRQDFLDAATNLGLAAPPPGVSPRGPVAAVAMEYSRIEDPSDPTGHTFVNNTRVVKFYVYKNTTVHGPLVRQDVTANLDGFTERPVPQVCMICHGGRYQTGASPSIPTWSGPSSANLGSQFLPFDLTSFDLPTVDHDNNPATPPKDFKASQQSAFKRLNVQMVLATDPIPPIRRVIERMYGASPGATNFPRGRQDERFIVGSPAPGWLASNDDKDMYRTVVGPTCRTCHIAQGSSIAWDQASSFKAYGPLIASYVCSLHVMPHALMTHRRFWLSLSPNRPSRLYTFLNTPPRTPPDQPLGDECITSP